MTRLRTIARIELRREAWKLLPRWHRLILRRRRRLPRRLVTWSVGKHVDAIVKAEARLPRRYRRALRGQAMRPSS